MAKTDFLNPFENGVTYADFLASVPKGKTLEEYCKGNLETDQIEWLLNDIACYKSNTATSEPLTEETTN